jgi:hypothetical protein
MFNLHKTIITDNLNLLLKVVTNEMGEALGEVLTITC